MFQCFKAEKDKRTCETQEKIFFTNSNIDFVNLYAIQYINLREHDK